MKNGRIEELFGELKRKFTDEVGSAQLMVESGDYDEAALKLYDVYRRMNFIKGIVDMLKDECLKVVNDEHRTATISIRRS